MELKQYLHIIKKDLKIFLGIIFVILAGTWAYFYFQPVRYVTSLTLNITRTGTEKTADYRYDGFYRLQADERFADTVVAWLESPRLVSEILEEKDGKRLSSAISAERRSSQMIAVEYETKDVRDAEKVAEKIISVLTRTIEKLNESQNDPDWFKIAAETPLITKYAAPYEKIIPAALLLGIFLAFWTVMLRHYFRKDV